MKAAKRKIARFRNKVVNFVRKRLAARKPKDVNGRIRQLEAAYDAMAQDFAVLKAEQQMAAVRQQALVDYYETRIDRIYARLSAQTAGVETVGIHIAQDGPADDVILDGFKKALQVQGGYVNIPLPSVLSDYLEPGDIRGPLTLQGFKIRRGIAQEQGDGVLVQKLDRGSQQTALYGPYKKLLPGRYSLTLRAQAVDDRSKSRLDAGFDIFCPSVDRTFGEAQLAATAEGDYAATVVFDWPIELAEREVELRVVQRALKPFKIIGFDIRAKDNN
ncbi:MULTISPECIES: hypothetical protein [unclassified Brevundimonas]|uniref:hypothetical protein n=1 Tax=unclassified Brevundimonas TaxID=2622653 RepID=UPI0025C1C150|nr:MULTISPECIES: hypothetical protein [unclassified Brevundimonas]